MQHTAKTCISSSRGFSPALLSARTTRRPVNCSSTTFEFRNSILMDPNSIRSHPSLSLTKTLWIVWWREEMCFHALLLLREMATRGIMSEISAPEHAAREHSNPISNMPQAGIRHAYPLDHSLLRSRKPFWHLR